MKNIFQKQNYSSYSKEDFKTWEILFSKQIKFLNEKNKATRIFYDGINQLHFNANKIPNFKEINEILKPINGWQIKGVIGLIDDNIFFELLSKKIFPVTIWLRPKESLNYIEEPDMFHDLFGHVPFLTNKTYTFFLERIGKHAKKIFKTNNKDRQHMMSRLYWYTIEFGLVKRGGNKFDILGAGIISSKFETIKALSNTSEKHIFNNELLKKEFYKHDLQNFYAYINKDVKFLNKIEIEKI